MCVHTTIRQDLRFAVAHFKGAMGYFHHLHSDGVHEFLAIGVWASQQQSWQAWKYPCSHVHRLDSHCLHSVNTEQINYPPKWNFSPALLLTVVLNSQGMFVTKNTVARMQGCLSFLQTLFPTVLSRARQDKTEWTKFAKLSCSAAHACTGTPVTPLSGGARRCPASPAPPRPHGQSHGIEENMARNFEEIAGKFLRKLRHRQTSSFSFVSQKRKSKTNEMIGTELSPCCESSTSPVLTRWSLLSSRYQWLPPS